MDETGEFPKRQAEWSSAEAKAKFSELVELSQDNGPQIITRNGKPRAVLVSATEWEKRRPRGTLYRVLRMAPDGVEDMNFDNPPVLGEGVAF